MTKEIQPKKNNLLHEAAIAVFPLLKQERTRSFLMVIFTFPTLILFGIFAINPTISTIIHLQRQLADNILVDKKLLEKINNLSVLQRKYDALQPDLALALAAIPESHKMPQFMGQVQALTTKNNVQLVNMHTDPLKIPTTTSIQEASFSFSLVVQGNYQNIQNFIASFMTFDRIVTIKDILISTSQNSQPPVTQANIIGKVYFKPF